MTNTDPSTPDPMAAARRLLGTETSMDPDASNEVDDGSVQTIDPELGQETNSADEEVLNEDELLEPVEEEISAYDRPGKWFVVHTQSGYEKKVKQNLEARVQSFDMEDKIYEVVVPMEDVTEFRNGQRVVVQKKMFPGYLLIRCRRNDDVHHMIRNTPGSQDSLAQGVNHRHWDAKRSIISSPSRRKAMNPSERLSRAFSTNSTKVCGSKKAHSRIFRARSSRSTRNNSKSKSWSTYLAERLQLSWILPK